MWLAHLSFAAVMLYIFPISYTQHHVIRKAGTDGYINLGSVFHTATANSRSECASLCASTSGCQSSMLMGHICSLYTQSCKCPGEKISDQLKSSYMLFRTAAVAVTTAWQNAEMSCMRHNMHLVAINSDIEQQALADWIRAKGWFVSNKQSITDIYSNTINYEACSYLIVTIS